MIILNAEIIKINLEIFKKKMVKDLKNFIMTIFFILLNNMNLTIGEQKNFNFRIFKI